MAADFRLATPRARFGNPEVGLGIMAASGATWRLRDLVGDAVAKQMLLAGRILDAREALMSGFVSEVLEPAQLLEGASRLVDRIVAQDRLAVRMTKLVMSMPRSAHPHIDGLAQAVLFESESRDERMTDILDHERIAQ
jgi:enoyl-CoA hydratase/carnithine racemase